MSLGRVPDGNFISGDTSFIEPVPPKPDATLGKYIKDDDFVEGVEKKETWKDSRIDAMQKNVFFLSLAQKQLKFDLALFLETGIMRALKPEPKTIVGLRSAVQDYKFDEPLAHDADVKVLLKRLKDVWKWHTKTDDRNRYLAPLLAVIQSSGTGKSRLLFEARRKLQNDNDLCRSILVTDREKDSVENKLQKNPQAYHAVYSVKNFKDSENRMEAREDFRSFILDQCRQAGKALTDVKQKSMKNIFDTEQSQSRRHNVTLFFDEAQSLTEHDGFLFRVLRWICREKEFPSTSDHEKYRIAAVLSGTTSSLANFFPETEKTTTNSSRFLEPSGPDDHGYFTSGTIPYEPFLILRTQGCLSSYRPPDGASEYETMIRFDDSI